MGMFHKNISEEKRASLELAEASREEAWVHPSFLVELFQGRVRWDLVSPFPKQNPHDKKEGDDFLVKLEEFLKKYINAEEIDRTGEISSDAIKRLFDLGAFAIKIPKDYGGLGFSQVNYNRAIHLVASHCGSTAVLLSAHQSIGVPQPLILFGTEEQKRKFLPRFRKDAISAFALTEPEAGSDPRSMVTTATPLEDGKTFRLNGKKLWCTNGTIADIIVVMAVTPPKIVYGKERKQITAFIVETNSPGFRVEHRCSFMGLHGIQNGVLVFEDVLVPKENIILGEGQGLKLALMTLNTGRLTMPAATTGVGKWCLNVSRRWASERKQWGQVIGEHESISAKIGSMTANVFAMEAMTWLVSHMADAKKFDIRLEAAVAKLFCTEAGWQIIDDTVQIRAGCGYESSVSLRERGETDFPVERIFRDSRINLIIEGTSEIMHLFIAREALDPHMQKIKTLISSRTSLGAKILAVFSMMGYYSLWLPWQYIPWVNLKTYMGMPAKLIGHMIFVSLTSKKLARRLFYKMMRYQKKLEGKQNILNRFVDIGCELFAMTCVCSYATELSKKSDEQKNSVELADLFCRESRLRIRQIFRSVNHNSDRVSKDLVKKVLAGEYKWLENDIMIHKTNTHQM